MGSFPCNLYTMLRLFRNAAPKAKLYFWRESAPIQLCEKQTLGYIQHQLGEDTDFLCICNLLQSSAEPGPKVLIHLD